MDVLKYLARQVRRTVDWTTDAMAGDGIDRPELDTLCDLADDVDALLGPLVEAWNQYSDGRPVLTKVDIERGHVYEHIWHPDPRKNKLAILTGQRIADPGQDNGSYEITVTPPDKVTVALFPPHSAGLQLVTGGDR
ncbi:hypothetical protein [Nocardia wallacei]|uniref:hypothetical protein n=1 Tax=Nocardia wallacei TaxID=480035 RepID=UPI002457124D|nr:hypothetical protein [Nocardia wallacei]